jgi:hypothetical protein
VSFLQREEGSLCITLFDNRHSGLCQPRNLAYSWFIWNRVSLLSFFEKGPSGQTQLHTTILKSYCSIVSSSLSQGSALSFVYGKTCDMSAICFLYVQGKEWREALSIQRYLDVLGLNSHLTLSKPYEGRKSRVLPPSCRVNWRFRSLESLRCGFTLVFCLIHLLLSFHSTNQILVTMFIL